MAPFIIKNEICPICQETKDVIELECGHIVCNECGKMWFNRSSSCPTCREDLTREILSEDFEINIIQERNLSREMQNDASQDVISQFIRETSNMFDITISFIREGNDTMNNRLMLVDAYLQYAVRRQIPPNNANIMINNILNGNI